MFLVILDRAACVSHGSPDKTRLHSTCQINHCQFQSFSAVFNQCFMSCIFSVHVISECCTNKECRIRNACVDLSPALLTESVHAAVLWDKPKDLLSSWNRHAFVFYIHYLSSVYMSNSKPLFSTTGATGPGTDRIWYTEPRDWTELFILQYKDENVEETVLL